MLQINGRNKSVVFTFGRMNPPTKGHELLVSKVIDVARSQSADHIIFLSHTQNDTTDPLDWNFKMRICQSAFPGIKISSDVSIKTPFQALQALSEQYDTVTFVVGDDRIGVFTERMTPYAAKFGVRAFQVISSGARNLDSAGIDGVSGTKTRKYVTENQKNNFMQVLPARLTGNMKSTIYSRVKQGLKID